MPLPLWREEPITKNHHRKGFDCGQDALNIFMAHYARQAHESGSAKTYCAINTQDDRTILGFYMLSPAQIDMHQVPMLARPSGGGHHPFGGFRLARLAVAKPFQGQSLGAHLLACAIARCIKVSKEVGGTALLIDAKNEMGAAWYKLYGAVALDGHPFSLVIPYIEFNKARLAAGLLPL